MVLYHIKEVPDFGRNQLAAMLYLLGAKTIVEVGVAEGYYSRTLCEYNPDAKVYGIDPYVPYRGYRDYTRISTFEKLRTSAEKRLGSCTNYQFIYEFSMESLRHFQDDSLDFVYLDGNHVEPYVSQDIVGWHAKLRPGGILAGHDYVRTKDGQGVHQTNDVKGAVRQFAKDRGLTLYILGREATNEGLVRDRPRSWMLWRK